MSPGAPFVFFPNLPQVVLDANARTILERRYLKHDDAGKPCETPTDLFWRVATNIAQADALYDDHADLQSTAETFYRMMAELRFLPNSPCLRGAGRELQQLSACFVLPIEDSLEGIFDTLKAAALIHKTGGGTGFNFSRLRAKNTLIKSTGGVSGGPISFMRVFNTAAGEVTQGGVRLGANMGILRVDHPDIEAFITCKSEANSFTHFNISVALDDTFMQAVENDQEYNLIHPHTGAIAGKRRARDIFDMIVRNAWRRGDPGIIFIDRINDSESNMTPALGKIESTNPCGEQPLLPYESCVLGSINVSLFVGNKEILWDALQQTVGDAIHFLDNVIDMNRYALPEIEKMAKGLRRVGLGVMGFADMLIALGVPYDSSDAIAVADKLMAFIDNKAREASERLAEERGAFPFFNQSLYAERGEKPIRNVARTTIAPTGTISTIAGCTSGIEPIFALVHRRKALWNASGATADLLVTYKPLETRLRDRELFTPGLMDELCNQGSARRIFALPDDIRKVFVTAHDIAPEAHVHIQAIFQKHVNNAVSKTINMPHDASESEVKNAYMLAYKTGCKGITIYRDGSISNQVLTVGDTHKEEKKKQEACVPADYGRAHCCPNCKTLLTAREGCFMCPNCGYSACSI